MKSGSRMSGRGAGGGASTDMVGPITGREQDNVLRVVRQDALNAVGRPTAENRPPRDYIERKAAEFGYMNMDVRQLGNEDRLWQSLYSSRIRANSNLAEDLRMVMRQGIDTTTFNRIRQEYMDSYVAMLQAQDHLHALELASLSR